MREQLIKEVEMIPLEIVVRNVAAGSLAKRLGIDEGVVLPRSIIEFYYKSDALDDPMVSEEHITAFGWANPAELDDIMSTVGGAIIGAGIGQAFDGTALPMVAGYFTVSIIGLVFVLIAEKGRLFQSQNPAV